MRTIKFLTLLFLLSFFSTALLAQGTQAVITGTITDKEGETIIGATVQVKNESTGFVSNTATNENGEYTFKQLPLGSPYTVSVTYIGYGDQRKTGFALNQGDMLRVDFEMTEMQLR